MIPEPQRTYVLELLSALGLAAVDFVVAGGSGLQVLGARGARKQVIPISVTSWCGQRN